MSTLQQKFEHDRTIWEQCATTYERQIVRGHPDVTAYEAFEHSFIDRLALHLTRDCNLQLDCYDFGCGSGRIHTLLAPLLFPSSDDTASTGRILHVGGIDFSEQMIRIAQQNLVEAGMSKLHPEYLSFDIGSAFDVPEYDGPGIPLAVSVCNSIGVMQGEEGAQKLFQTMNRYVQKKKGMAVISCYRKEAVAGYALGNYESTMDVSGQPCWLSPDTYAKKGNKLVPRYYKRAHDQDSAIIVDVFNSENKYHAENIKLSREPDRIRDVIATGIIKTFDGYHSRWYSTDIIKKWMRQYWHQGTRWHLAGTALDLLRGEPAQLAIVDYSGHFASIARKWNLTPLT